MTDLHLVVDLDAVLDDGVADRAAVYGRVRTDLDVIADRNPAELRHLDIAVPVLRLAEAVGADHDPRMQQASRADAGPRAQRDVRDAAAAGTEHDTVQQDRVGAEERSCADRRAGADVAMRADPGARVDRGVVCDDRGRVTPAREGRLGIQVLRDAGIGRVRVRSDERSHGTVGGGVRLEHDDRGPRGGEVLAVLRVRKE